MENQSVAESETQCPLKTNVGTSMSQLQPSVLTAVSDEVKKEAQDSMDRGHVFVAETNTQTADFVYSYQNPTGCTYQFPASCSYQVPPGCTYQVPGGYTYQNPSDYTYQNPAAYAYQNQAGYIYQAPSDYSYQVPPDYAYQVQAGYGYRGPTYRNYSGLTRSSYRGPGRSSYRGPAHGNYRGSSYSNYRGALCGKYSGPAYSNFRGPFSSSYRGPGYNNYRGQAYSNYRGPIYSSYRGPAYSQGRYYNYRPKKTSWKNKSHMVMTMKTQSVVNNEGQCSQKTEAGTGLSPHPLTAAPLHTETNEAQAAEKMAKCSPPEADIQSVNEKIKMITLIKKKIALLDLNAELDKKKEAETGQRKQAEDGCHQEQMLKESSGKTKQAVDEKTKVRTKSLNDVIGRILAMENQTGDVEDSERKSEKQSVKKQILNFFKESGDNPAVITRHDC